IETAFDDTYYRAHNPVVSQSHSDALLHFLTIGWREGRNPRPDFDIAYYLAENADIRQSGQNPFLHWVRHGRKEGRPGTDPNAPSPPAAASTRSEEIDWTLYSPEELAAISDTFDTDFYIREYPEVADLDVDPKVHYLVHGWRLGYDPNPEFSTSYYIERHIDIRSAGINPFVHFCRFGHKERRETVSHIETRRRDYRPLVSVIVPNYNHARFLQQRLESIVRQSYDHIELIILDDASTDDSRDVIRQTLDALCAPARLDFSDQNSGSVFAQWQKGIRMARGELVWICESDDFCDLDFLEHLVPRFADDSVNIAFGRIQFCDQDGQRVDGLDAYRERAEPWIWDRPLTRPAAQWFNGGFGVRNVIANVGGCLMRRMSLPEEVWREVRSFKISGDWMLYLHVAGSGQIAYDPAAIAYFRQHSTNTSARNFHQRYYYDESARMLTEIARHWGISQETRARFIQEVRAQFAHLGLSETLGDFEQVFDLEGTSLAQKSRLHVQIYFLGFHLGGGEVFAINLANALIRFGYAVSMVAVDTSVLNMDMRARLDARIPIYHATHISQVGRGAFFDHCGVDLINSHVASVDAFLYSLGNGPIERPYTVTLHGSYVAFETAPSAMVDWVLANVSSWIYVADRNLEFFEDRAPGSEKFTKIPNAMPDDPRTAAFTRDSLGIEDTDTVFVLIGRGIKRKGWRAAIEAFRKVSRQRPEHRIHLLMAGEGPETDRARDASSDLERVHVLGYQSEINGILRLSDCLLLPSRFEGESYPLTLVQAFQEHLPVIATDIGEIKSMITAPSGQKAGILLRDIPKHGAFFNALADAMIEMLDPAKRAEFAAISKDRAKVHSMEEMIAAYDAVFRDALAEEEEIAAIS
ncbi:MAG: glycosyltransferase, partial [Pseudomonadota bacterium]